MLLLLSLLAVPSVLAAGQEAAAQLASLYGLSTSTSFPFPAATQQAESLIVSQWSLGKGHIQDNPQNLAFVADPFPTQPPPNSSPPSTNATQPVLQVTYDAGSYSHQSGGSQWYNLWNSSDGSAFQTMLATYEVAFDDGFQWVKGGKLPGLRGGLNSTGCSGGNEADGKDCFSTRLMWRRNGAGEVYAYIPTKNNLCKQDQVLCNSDFGVSIHRGAFTFASGQWNRVALLVRMNNPPNRANGNIQLFFNDVLAIDQTGLQIRSSSTVSVNGLYFSTFFGGSDSSWATPQTTHTYYRNLQLWGSSAASNLTGPTISAGRSAKTVDVGIHIVVMFMSCVLGVWWI